MKRQVIETSTGSQKSSSPTKTGMLSRESSFKSMDKGKTKPANQLFYANLSNNDILETARSPRTGPQLQTPKGTLLKSNSFSTINTKPKVKLVDEVVPQKQKGAKEYSSINAKEGPARMMGKSMSFKSLGRPNGSDSKVKMLSSNFSHTHELKGSKGMKEKSTFERKNLAKLDRSHVCSLTTPKVDQKLTPRGGDAVSLPSVPSNRESRGLHSDGKLSTSTKLARNRVEVPLPSVGATNGSEKTFNQISPKDEPSLTSSWTVERPPGNFNGNPDDGLPRLQESTNQAEKTRDGSISHLRHPIISGSKGLPCQKCKEVCHTVDNCPTDNVWGSGSDISATRNPREEMNKGNKVKAAMKVVRNMPGFGKNRLDQSDGFSGPGMDAQGHLPVSNKLKNSCPAEGTHEVQGSFSSDSYKQATNNEKQLAAPSSETGFAPTLGDSDSNVPSVAKQTIRDWSSNSLAAIPLILNISAIPEHEFIWQGLFEVHRGGKPPDLYGGIQAHLSTLASPRVPEAVNKFPGRVPLNEVPRLSTWPAQFHGSGAKEDHIALYFFAKDLNSYEKSYKGLVDSMIKKDLALKGNIDDVELLIFASNQLPENCQRWNTLFFLWGVFRGRRESFSSSFKNPCIRGMDVGSTGKDISSDVLSQNHCSSKQGVKESSTKAMASKAPEKTGLTANGSGNNQVSSLEQTYLGSEARPEVKFTSHSLEEHDCSTFRLEVGSGPSAQTNGTNSGSDGGKKARFHFSALERTSKKVPPVGNQEVAVVHVNINEEHTIERRGNDGTMVKLESSSEEDDRQIDAENSLVRDLNCWQTRDRKRPHLDLTEPQTSSGTSHETSWNEIGNAFIDGESVSKKLKTGFSEVYGCNSSRDITSFSDGFESDLRDLRPGSSSGQRYKKACDERDIPTDFGGAERYFFPVCSQHVKGFQLGNTSMPLKELSSEDEDQINDAVPSLELALGAERKLPNKGILPFFVGMAEQPTNEGKPPDKVKIKEEEEEVSASLSLSLSFPFPDTERTMKPVSKKEQLLPERHSVNTSLLLFGSLPDK
ncbi:uncharacterized protein LOC110815951 isoform X1 [Carica papaya]|uniref:uncharacterized protein LOC110815951 isoform X1 n=1 Tax=Carica papaya TaxID=3649 RepID=UPI000B8D0E36|nr:uncharacterized protein LOC110815951 isoform X1 [Carica papaya]